MTKVHMPKALLGRVSGFKRSEKLAEAGRRLVHDGVVSINGYTEVAVDIQQDWSANPLGSRSWQWAVAAFRFMPALIARHAASLGLLDPASIAAVDTEVARDRQRPSLGQAALAEAATPVEPGAAPTPTG